MDRERQTKLSNNIFGSSTIAKLVAIFALAALFSLYFQNIGALIAMLVLTAGIFIGNSYESRH